MEIDPQYKLKYLVQDALEIMSDMCELLAGSPVLSDYTMKQFTQKAEYFKRLANNIWYVE
jgi:hypothetical protein